MSVQGLAPDTQMNSRTGYDLIAHQDQLGESVVNG